MTLDTTVSNHDDASPAPVDADLYRQLIQQLYENSLQRYGIDSEQSRMLKMHLIAHAVQD